MMTSGVRPTPASGPPRARWLALAAGLVAAAGLAAAGQAEAASPECKADPQTNNPDLYACTASTDANVSRVTFDEILDGVRAAGADVTAADPAMWITAWGGQGGKGNFCFVVLFNCTPDGGAGGKGGVAQTPVSPETFATAKTGFGTSTLHYWIGSSGADGGEYSKGGAGGAGTVVATSPPARSSIGQAPDFASAVTVGGGGGGGGSGGTEHDGGAGGVGGKALATFTSNASTAGGDGGKDSGGTFAGGDGGNSKGAGSGGKGACSDVACVGTEGVGGFGGFGRESAATGWVNQALYGSPVGSAPTWKDWLQTPGGGGGGARSFTGKDAVCGTFLTCAGGGGGGYGGGGGGEWDIWSTGFPSPGGGGGGGAGGSYAHSGTCDATDAPVVSNNNGGDGRLVIYVDPSQECSGAAPAVSQPAGVRAPRGRVSDTTLIRKIQPVSGAVTSTPDATTEVRVQLAGGARIATAKLNGRGVGDQFRPVGANAWVARLGREDGARQGTNQVIVRARRGRGEHYGTASFIRAQPAELLDTELASRRQGRRLLVQEQVEGRRESVVAVDGRRVPAGYIIRQGDRLSVRLTPTGGLGHGQNRVTAQVASPNGATETEAQTVRVPAASPIADAGPNQRRAVHAGVRLDGSRSLAPSTLGQAPTAVLQQGGSDTGLSYAWRIIRRPPGAGATLAGADTPTPSFRASAPGTYRVQLTVAANGRASSDVTEVSVDPVPMAPIETLATNAAGAPGIQLDSSWFCGADGTNTSCLFHANPAKVDTQVQLLVLDRATLETVSNTSYDPSDLLGLNKAISELVVDDGGAVEPDTTKLVIITLGSGAVTDLTNFEAGLKRIGAGAPGPDEAGIPAPLSIIGIPGTTLGKAWTNFGRSIGTNPETGDANPQGSLTGYIKDSAYYLESGVLENEQRVFTFGDVRSFETRQVEGDTITVAIAGKVATFDTSAGGLGLVTFDPFTLTPSGSTTFAPQGSGNGLDWAALATALEGAVNSGSGVALVSLGQMGDFASEPQAGSFATVLSQLEKLGVQPDIFARAVNDNGTYSMLSSGGQGVTSSSEIAAGVQTGEFQLPVAAGNQTGELQRTNDGRYIPTSADPNAISEPDAQLTPILYEAPADWLSVPSPDLGVQTALAWLAQCQFVDGGVDPGVRLWDGQRCSYSAADGPVTGTPDAGAVARIALELRADYYDNADFTANNIAGLTYAGLFPAGNQVFSAADFEAAKAQLVQESAAIGATRGFFTTLKCSLSTCAGDSNQISNVMTQVAIAVQNAYFGQEQATVRDTTAFAEEMFTTWDLAAASFIHVLVAAGLDELEPLFILGHVLGDGSEAAFTTINGPGESEWVDIDAWDVIDNQLQNAEGSADQQVTDAISLASDGLTTSEDIVLSDWGRLQAVAANSQNAWRISSDDVEDVANLFVISARLQMWEAYANTLWTARFNPTGSQARNMAARICNNAWPYKQAALTGVPTGIAGPQYFPVESVATSGKYPSYRAYIALQQDDLDDPAPGAALRDIFSLPSDLGATSTAAGGYAPTFWAEVFELDKVLGGCNN